MYIYYRLALNLDKIVKSDALPYLIGFCLFVCLDKHFKRNTHFILHKVSETVCQEDEHFSYLCCSEDFDREINYNWFLISF